MHSYFTNEARQRIKDKNNMISINNKKNKIKISPIYENTEILNNKLKNIENIPSQLKFPKIILEDNSLELNETVNSLEEDLQLSFLNLQNNLPKSYLFTITDTSLENTEYFPIENHNIQLHYIHSSKNVKIPILRSENTEYFPIENNNIQLDFNKNPPNFNLNTNPYKKTINEEFSMKNHNIQLDFNKKPPNFNLNTNPYKKTINEEFSMKNHSIQLDFNKKPPNFNLNTDLYENTTGEVFSVENNDFLFKQNKQNKENKQNKSNYRNKKLCENSPINYNNLIREFPNKTIHFVYQYTYKSGEKVSGFGDYIRGLYFILQFVERYKCNIEFHCNHKIGNYLEYFCNKSKPLNFSPQNVFYSKLTNWSSIIKNQIIDYKYIDVDKDIIQNIINNIDTSKQDLYIYLANHPNQNTINEKHKIFVRKLINPTNYLKNIVDEEMVKLNIIKYNFITINIRTGDSSFTTFTDNNKEFIPININYLLYLINIVITKNKLDILIITSDNNIKKILVNTFKHISFKFNLNTICHTADNNASSDSIINTLKDFYIMSYSKYIYSFSVYEHGSGFSKWCAETYNIPYICYNIKNKK
jgi:hypothetical protein